MNNNYDNLKIKYDNMVIKFNEREAKHKEQLESFGKLINDLKLQRNAVEDELFRYVKLYNETENKYSREKELLETVLNNIDNDVSDYKNLNPDIFLINLRLMQDCLSKVSDPIDELRFDGVCDERFHVHKIDETMDEIDQNAAGQIFVDIKSNYSYKRDWEDIGGKFYDFWESIEKKKEELDKDYNFRMEFKAYKKSCELTKKFSILQNTLIEIQETILYDLIDMNFIDYDGARKLYNDFYKELRYLKQPEGVLATPINEDNHEKNN